LILFVKIKNKIK